MIGLSCGEEIVTIRSVILIQYQRVTDRRPSDGRTDVQPISITCFSIADARKTLLTALFKNSACRSNWATVTNSINIVCLKQFHKETVDNKL